MKNSIKNAVKQFIVSEDGDQAVQLAVLFPIILLIVGFIVDRFIQYEGVTAVSSAANEAIRYAVVAEDTREAEQVIIETLSDRMDSSSLGWCVGNENNSCSKWGTNISQTSDVGAFETNKNTQLLIHVDDKGWCNGSYLQVGVRAHKSSIFPSYESFRHLVKSGGPIYHQHTYMVTARVESNNKCGK